MTRKRVNEAPAFQSWDEVNQALAIIADNQRSKEAIEAEMQETIDNAKAAADMKARAHVEVIAKLEYQIMLYVEANKGDLGAKKTKVLTFGKVGFRKSTKAVLPKGRAKIDEIIARIKERGMLDCIKNPLPTIDKDALKKYPEADIKAVGASLKVDDIFWYEADREQLPQE